MSRSEAARLLLSAVLRGGVRVGSLTVVEGSTRRTFGSSAPHATVHVHSESFWTALLRGSRGMAEAYGDGLWNSPDLVAVIRVAARNAVLIDRTRAAIAPLRWPWQRARSVFERNTRARSRAGISAHYDLGNELFSRMLDPTMMYSCAVFEAPEMTLEEASLAKLELVCRKLALGPGDRLLEIGSGWGALAIYAARTRGCRVTTTTISREQHAYAREQVHAAGLEELVEVRLEDYRDLRGRYDKLVSIEMIEAVGWQHIGAFLAKCSSLLERDGSMLLQAITIDDRAYEVEKASHSFIKTHIFPGGCLPSLEVITRSLARRTDLQVRDLQDITSHYVPTLRCWRERFLRCAGELEALGYDARFRRIWELYLAYCEAGFAERRILDVQILAAKPNSRIATRERALAPHGLQSSTALSGAPRAVGVSAGQRG